MPRKIRKDKADGSRESSAVDAKLIAKLCDEELAGRVAAINWSAAQGEEIKLEIFAKHSELISHRRTIGERITKEFSYAMFILAVKIIRSAEESLSRKKTVTTLECDEIARKRAAGFKKPKRTKSAPKYRQVKIQFLALIDKLRNEYGYSWSEVCAYLQNYHQFIATRAYIQKAYAKAQKEVAEEEKLNASSNRT